MSEVKPDRIHRGGRRKCYTSRLIEEKNLENASLRQLIKKLIADGTISAAALQEVAIPLSASRVPDPQLQQQWQQIRSPASAAETKPPAVAPPPKAPKTWEEEQAERQAEIQRLRTGNELLEKAIAKAEAEPAQLTQGKSS